MSQDQSKYSGMVVLFIVALLGLATYLINTFWANAINRNLLLIALAISIVIVLFRHPRLLLLVMVIALTTGANLPGEASTVFGYSQTVLVTSLALLVLISLLNYVFILLPTGDGRNAKLDTVVSRKAVLKAIMENNKDRLAQLMEINVEINFSHNGAVPILVAAEFGNIEILLMLAKYGVNFSILDEHGKTPLEIALANGFARAAEIIHYASEGKPLTV